MLPKSLYRISDEREYILYRALLRKHKEEILHTDTDLCRSIISLPNISSYEIEKKLQRIDHNLKHLFYVRTNNFEEIIKEEQRKQSAIRKGLTGDEDTDKLILMHKLLTKKGYIKS